MQFNTIDHDKQVPNMADNLKGKKGKFFHSCKYAPGCFPCISEMGALLFPHQYHSAEASNILIFLCKFLEHF